MQDPVDLLRPPALPDGEPLRGRLLARTLREVRRQRRLRRLQALGVLAASFAAGFFTLAALVPPPCAPERALVRPAEPPAVLSTPVALEWQALDRPAEAPVLYREAGDAYLSQGDPAEALRCYGNALDESADLEVSSDDSWLMIAIKHARKQEMQACPSE
jgi:hypothetical protein